MDRSRQPGQPLGERRGHAFNSAGSSRRSGPCERLIQGSRRTESASMREVSASVWVGPTC